MFKFCLFVASGLPSLICDIVTQGFPRTKQHLTQEVMLLGLQNFREEFG